MPIVNTGRLFSFVAVLALANGLSPTGLAQTESPEAAPESASTPSAPTTKDGLNLDMKLEDLAKQDVMVPGLSTVVSTVERQESTIGRSPNAVFVITPDMIKRSGARNVPEALRMAPGIDVARVNAYTWAISARGFNDTYANKLLVQIDGRVIYNAAFGGVYWNQQNVVLPDVERIEVIRGPGTTMWGSNAVNGVINVITKKTRDTQGALIQSGGGDQERDFNTVRYGGTFGEDATWRVYGQEFDRNRGWLEGGSNDAWVGHQGGFRMDYTPTKEDTLTVQGDLFNGAGGQQFVNMAIPTPPFDTNFNGTLRFPAGNLLARWDRVIDDDTSWQVLTYYDRLVQDAPQVLGMQIDTWDIDLQYQFSPAENHRFITGANYRRAQDAFDTSFALGYSVNHFVTEWSGVFAQDTITLAEDRLYFTIGTRLEQNTFGGFQVEPTARLLFLPSKRQSAWAAVSRAIRNPTRTEATVNFKRHVGPPNVPLFVNTLGTRHIQPENVLAYEIGYRAAPTDDFTWDIAGYINDYHKLLGPSPVGPPVVVPPGYVFLPSVYANNMRALTYGAELTGTYQITDDWRLFASYSVFEVNAQGDGLTLDQVTGNSPNNQAYMRSSWDLSEHIQYDLIGRYVDSLATQGVPSYIEMDMRIGWQATKTMEFSFVGQNLIDSHHPEFGNSLAGVQSTQVRRGWYAMLSWEY
jgi:iron complex outermembrane receptor protein